MKTGTITTSSQQSNFDPRNISGVSINQDNSQFPQPLIQDLQPSTPIQDHRKEVEEATAAFSQELQKHPEEFSDNMIRVGGSGQN